MSHFLLDCPKFRKHFDSLWANLTIKVTKSNDNDGRQMSEFIAKRDRSRKRCYTLGISSPPFWHCHGYHDNPIYRGTSWKIYKLLVETLRELRAPWLSHYGTVLFLNFI